MPLTTTDHDRGAAGLTYVYPVVSRRARGVSVGVNLNPNKACNWRCIYCQVPGLVRGQGPPIDIEKLRDELRWMLTAIVKGDFLAKNAPEGARRLNDIAFSGDGEPTSSPQLLEALEVTAELRAELGLGADVKTIFITNGSLVERPEVARALERLRELNGEVWFKLDSATREGFERINSMAIEPATHLERLKKTAALCPTWVQTCVFALDGEEPDEREKRAYLDALAALVKEGVPLRGVLLYGLARASHQPEAPRLSRLPESWLDAFAREIEKAGLRVEKSP